MSSPNLRHPKKSCLTSLNIKSNADCYQTTGFMKLKHIPSRDSISRRASFLEKILEDSIELRSCSETLRSSLMQSCPTDSEPSSRGSSVFGEEQINWEKSSYDAETGFLKFRQGQDEGTEDFFEEYEDRSDSDQSEFSMSIYSPESCFADLREQLGKRTESECSIPPKEPKVFNLKTLFCSSFPTDLEENAPLESRNSSHGDFRLLTPPPELPTKPEYVPIFEALEPFQKPHVSEGQPSTITLDDLNVRMIGKAARKARNNGGYFESLVNIFQAHSLMPHRLGPRLTKVHVSHYPSSNILGVGSRISRFSCLNSCGTWFLLPKFPY